MDAVVSSHPTDQILSSYGLGKLDDASAQAVNEHLEECPDCRKRVAEMPADSLLGRVRAAQGLGKSILGQSQGGGTQTSKGRDAPAPPPADTLPPGLVDHPDYEIKRELGRGGMGVVYLAHNRLMGRDEVLKVMGRQIMDRPGVLDRFLREIRAVARLRHPNIVTAFHATRLGESLVFAMEYVDGLDLARLVKSRGPLPVAHACNFVHQAALGLQHAHEEGLVHRDIKPSNLMLARKGDKATVKVLDFGLARVTSEQKVDGGLTSQGQALGTPDYIAPEQIVDAPNADIRADIYSLGATLYYLLAGHPPFQADSLYDMFQAHMSRDADPLNLVRPEVPSELAAVVAKMMAKDPARRFQTPVEVAQALTPFFKKGNVAFKAPRVEMSQAGQTGTGQPTRDRAGPVEPPKKAAEPTVPEPPWQSLIDSRETEHPKAKTPAAARSRRPPWLWPAVAVGVLVLGLVAWGVTLRVKTPDGIIELVNLPNDADVLIDAREVTVTLPGGGKPAVITVPAGKRNIQVKKDGYKVSGEEVTIPAGGKVAFTVRLIPIADSRPTKIDADDRTSRSDAVKPPAAPVNREVVTTTPTPPQVPTANSNTNPTVAMDKRDGKANAAGRVANEPARPRAMDAAEALKGKAEFLSGRWLVEGRELVQIDPAEGSGKVVFGDLHWTDYDITVHLMREEGKGCALVLLFRRILRNSNHLHFLISDSDVESTVEAYVDGNERVLGSVGSRVVNHKWYRAGVSVHRNHIVCTLHDDGENEVVHIEAEDDRHPSGQVGLDTWGGSWRFKNIKVTAPDGKTLWEMPPAGGAGGSPTSAGSGLDQTPVPPAARNPDPRSNPGPFINTIGMTMKLIPAGEFLMGSPGDAIEAEKDEKPQHRVRITKPFYLGVSEVTQGQYEAVMGNNPSRFSANGGGKDRVAGQSTDQYPVEMVSWLDAVQFCNKLSEMERKKPFYEIDGKETRVPDWNGQGYRLPTEAEWEYACRANASTPTRFSFGDSMAELGLHGWFDGNSEQRTHPVGQKRSNGFGLYDMHGNVWEWCWDWYGDGYYNRSAADNPIGPVGASYRVYRGGGWSDGPRLARSALRSRRAPGFRNGVLGFRLARGQFGR